MFYRLLGRFFFYFHVLPFIKKIIFPIFRDGIIKAIENFLFPPDEALGEKLLRDKDNGLTDVQIATKYRLSPSKVRRIVGEAMSVKRTDNITRAKALRGAGKSVAEISKLMNLSESSILAMLSAES